MRYVSEKLVWLRYLLFREEIIFYGNCCYIIYHRKLFILLYGCRILDYIV